MKPFFLGAIVLAAGLYGVAVLTLHRPPEDGVIRIRWATDPNPARKLQVEIFGKLQVRLHEADVSDWRRLAGEILSARQAQRTASGRLGVLRRLAEELDANGAAALEAVASGGRPTGALERAIRALNAALERPDLFPPALLPGLDLSKDARLLIGRRNGQQQAALSKVEVAALNRRILEAAFPGLLARAQRIEASVESGAREKLIVQCATGTGPDVLDVYNHAQMLTFVEAGILVDVTDVAGPMGFGLENTYPALRTALTVDGRQYRYPCNVWANCVIYNRAVFDDHGVPYPREGWTYDDLIDAGRRIVAGPGASGRRHLAVAHYSPPWMFDDLLIGRGGRYFTPDGLRSALDSPEALDVMRLYHDLMHVHRVFPTPAEAAAMSSQGGWGSGAINWFSNGQAAMMFIGRWYLCQVPNYPDLKGKLGSVRLPSWPGRPSAGSCGTRAGGVNATSPHRQAGLKFLQYLASEDYGRVIVYDGDALPPNPALARKGADLVNPPAPEAAFHQPFIDALATARPTDYSPFIDGTQMDRWILEAVQKVENGLLTPDAAAAALAAEINQQIRLNIARRADLRRRFEALAGCKWTADWNHEEPRRR